MEAIGVVDWTQRHLEQLKGAADAAFFDAAQCRKVLEIEERPGARTVEVRRLQGASNWSSVINVVPAVLDVTFEVDLTDNEHPDELELLLTAAAAELGLAEDKLILQGFRPARNAADAAPAVAAAGYDHHARIKDRHIGIASHVAWGEQWDKRSVEALAGDAADVVLKRTVKKLGEHNKQGALAAIMRSELWWDVAHVPIVLNAPSPYSQLENSLGSSRITHSSGFDANVRAVVFRPTAVQLVVAERPRIVVLGVVNDTTKVKCMIRERIALVVREPGAIAIASLP